MKKIVLFVCAALLFGACGSQKKTDETTHTRSLVLYYSQLGSTRQVAKLIKDKVGADIEEITLVTPYDTSFQKTIERCNQERSAGILPDIHPIQSVLADYDTIYLGYPIWFGTYAPPIASLLREVDFTGKVIVPFCTFGSGGVEASRDSLLQQLPDNLVLEGYGVRAARVGAAAAELEPWLIRIEALPGEFVPMPEFTVMKPLTPETQALFDEACGDYPMPLGTPVGVARCVEPDTNLVCFETHQVRRGGDTSVSFIHVLKSASGKAEFIKVVR